MAAPKGNHNAVRGTRWRQALERALGRAGNGDIAKGLSPIADVVVQLATSGDFNAIREIADRLDGRTAQAVELAVTRSIPDMDDETLAGILAQGGGGGDASEADVSQVAPGIH